MNFIPEARMAMISGGKDDLGCATYLISSGIVAGVAGMAFGPVGAFLVAGFLVGVNNPCDS